MIFNSIQLYQHIIYKNNQFIEKHLTIKEMDIHLYYRKR